MTKADIIIIVWLTIKLIVDTGAFVYIAWRLIKG